MHNLQLGSKKKKNKPSKSLTNARSNKYGKFLAQSKEAGIRGDDKQIILAHKRKSKKSTKHKREDFATATKKILQRESSKSLDQVTKIAKDPPRSKKIRRRPTKRNSKRNIGRKLSGRKVGVKPSGSNVAAVKKVEKLSAEIRNKSERDIREELKGKGVVITGKNGSAARDILLCLRIMNINVRHE